MIYAICNPIAGHGRGKKIGALIERTLKEKKLACQLEMTVRPGHATELARKAVKAGAELILAIGGDGTAFETAQGVMCTQTPLGIIPAGTGNDFVKTIRIPLDPLEALEKILSSPSMKTDVGLLNGRMFLNEIGTGFDVMVLDYAKQVKGFSRGIIPYFYGVLQSLFRFKSIDLTYTIENGETIQQKAFVMAVANGGTIGGGMVIAPEAQADDGLLDVVIVGDVKKKDLPNRLIGLMKGKILTFPETQFYRVKRLSFTAPNMRINIDGEIISAKEADVHIMPGAVFIRR